MYYKARLPGISSTQPNSYTCKCDAHTSALSFMIIIMEDSMWALQSNCPLRGSKLGAPTLEVITHESSPRRSSSKKSLQSNIVQFRRLPPIHTILSFFFLSFTHCVDTNVDVSSRRPSCVAAHTINLVRKTDRIGISRDIYSCYTTSISYLHTDGVFKGNTWPQRSDTFIIAICAMIWSLWDQVCQKIPYTN
jgi:hypothetical protein